MKLNFLLLFFILIFIPFSTFATHNRAGEITYRQTGDLSVIATLITYTKTESASADRDTITIFWGDGTSTNVKRSNGNGTELANSVKKNIYIAAHTYPGRGTYNISMIDPNRIADILNVDPPNSINIPFFIQSTVTLFNTTFQGINNSPILLNDPIGIACLGQVFIHNPSAYDIDGDSLGFSITTPFMDFNTPVPNYLLPNLINPGPNNLLNLDSRTGTLIWQSPQRAGEYNIAIEISEYRRGIKIGSVIRDMQILVLENCKNNSPPTIAGIKDTCVIAGALLDLNYIIDDINKGSRGGRVKIETGGGAMQVKNPAIATFEKNYQNPIQVLNIKWQTACEHVQNEYYSIFIQVTDDYYDTTGLSTILTLRIKVTAPPPTNLIGLAGNNEIELFWDEPYDCDSISSELRGFSVWRSEKSQIITQDICEPGLEKSAYERIAYLTYQSKDNRLYFKDSSVQKGVSYCYRVQAEFSKLSPSGFPFNFSPSLASNETCTYLSDDKPVLLNVDVIKTDTGNGQIMIKWAKPDFEKFDTAQHNPPYQINIRRSSDKTNWSDIQNVQINSLLEFIDTVKVDSHLNTLNISYYYQVEIMSIDGYKAASSIAQSVFILPSIQNISIQLTWNEITPWNNYLYRIFRKSILSPNYEEIGTMAQKLFIDFNVLFGETYCYYVLSEGEYANLAFTKPLLNHSQEICILMQDTSAPCCPKLLVEGPCGSDQSSQRNYNILRWNNPNISCESQDVSGYRIYVERADGNTELLIEINDPSTIVYQHDFTLNEPICYIIKSIDTTGLECLLSEKMCVEYCPEYILPNTFTPDNDGANDLFKPIKNQFIQKVEFSVINRWGQSVFSTNHPSILWDGTDHDGKKLSDGVYYYQCKIVPYPNQLGIGEQVLTGFIELITRK
ncbi:MAG: gliding motility-associated C-terminal domain-containing protein [Saprospiraceae bacterium]|nr:gliding motility-associated C-terminal domain-containing protein [Saprospiraceae bacterium]